MLTLMLTLSLSATPFVPTMMPGETARSARLLEADVVKLERKLVSAERMLPVWAPLTAGLVGGAALGGLALYMLTSITLNYGTAALALLCVVGAPVALVAGIITAIVFAVQNSTARTVRVNAIRYQLRTKRAELERLGEVAPVSTPPLLTF